MLEASYPAVVTDGRREFVPEPWGDDPRLVAVLGERGAAGFRALLDGFPDPVGVLWAIRDAESGVVDFAFGYGNPAMLRGFRLPAETRDRYTLLGALPQMRESRVFDEYVRVCEIGEPLVGEVTYDTPFGDGYMLGTFLHRAARLGDGVIVFLHDVTASRRMEAELVAYADVVAHDLSAPLAGIAMLVNVLELRPDEPPAPEVLQRAPRDLEARHGSWSTACWTTRGRGSSSSSRCRSRRSRQRSSPISACSSRPRVRASW